MLCLGTQMISGYIISQTQDVVKTFQYSQILRNSLRNFPYMWILMIFELYIKYMKSCKNLRKVETYLTW